MDTIDHALLGLSWTSITSRDWVPTPWVATAISILLASFVLDAFMARRYSGGSGNRDQGSCAILMVAALMLGCGTLTTTALGLGRVPVGGQVLPFVGLIACAAGLAFRYAAIFTLGKQFTFRVSILPDHQLIRHGVYRVVRHPSYTGGLLFVLGVLLLFANWIGLVGFFVGFAPLLLWRVRIEERVLRQHFGAEYEDYARATPALIPFMPGDRSPTRAPASQTELE